MENELNIPGFKHYERESTYQAKLAAGEVNAKDLSFVKETGKIYTQGGEYGGGSGSGGSGESVTDKFIRTLYGPYEELTDEQRAYNVETFNMYGDPDTEMLPTIVLGGSILVNIDNNSSKITYGVLEERPTTADLGSLLARMIVYLFSDGSVQVDESSYTQCFSFCLLYLAPQMAEMFFTGYDKFAGVKGVMSKEGRYSFVDTVVDQIKDGSGTSRYVEWNDGDKRYRTHFDTSYRVSSTEEILSGGSGGGGTNIVVDTAMSDSSENAVQNKVIKAYVDNAVANTGGGGGDYLEVRELKMNDDMTVTEEQKAYNIETYNKAQAGEAFVLSAMGVVLDLVTVMSDAVLFSLLVPNPFGNRELISLNIALFADGTFHPSQLDYCTRDTAMSDESENAVQNKVVKKYIDDAVAGAITTTLNTAV